MPGIYKCILYLTIGISIIFVLRILRLDVKCKSIRKMVLNKAKMSFICIRLVTALASIVLMACMVCKVYIIDDINAETENKAFEYGDQYTIAENMDTVLLLQKDEWGKLDTDQRLDVLQCICEIEGNYLGLNKRVEIKAAELEDHVMGNYNDASSVIHISNDTLENEKPYDALNTVCHEMYHAAQFRFCEIYEGLSEEDRRSYFMYKAAVYSEEFKDYKNGLNSENESEFAEYYGQNCEYDAREYSKQAVEEYYKRIAEYLVKDYESGD